MCRKKRSLLAFPIFFSFLFLSLSSFSSFHARDEIRFFGSNVGEHLSTTRPKKILFVYFTLSLIYLGFYI